MKNNQFCIYFLPAYLLVILANDLLYKRGLLLVPVAFFLLGTGAALCSSRLRAESNRRLLIGFCVLSLILMIVNIATTFPIIWIRINAIELEPLSRWFRWMFDYGWDPFSLLYWILLVPAAIVQPGCFLGGIYWGKLMRK